MSSWPSASSPTARSAAATTAASFGPAEGRALLARLARVGRPRAEGCPEGDRRADEGRGLQPLGPLPARAAHPRAAPARGNRPRSPRAADARARATARRPRRRLRRLPAGGAVRALDRDPRQREGEARRPRGRAAAGRPDRRRGRLDAWRHPHDRAHPRARRARLRGRGDRHRRARRPPASRPSPRSTSLLRRDSAWGSRACRSWSRRWPTAATSSCTWSRRGRPGSAPRSPRRSAALPICGSYHTELAAYAGLRAADPRIEAGMRMALVALLRPVRGGALAEPRLRRSLAALGIDPERIGRWARGVDLALTRPPAATPVPSRARSRSSTPAA